MFIFSIFCIKLKMLPLHFYVVCPEGPDRTNLSNTIQCTCTLGSLSSNRTFFSKSFNRNEVDREFTTQTLLMKWWNNLIAALIPQPPAHTFSATPKLLSASPWNWNIQTSLKCRLSNNQFVNACYLCLSWVATEHWSHNRGRTSSHSSLASLNTAVHWPDTETRMSLHDWLLWEARGMI